MRERSKWEPCRQGRGLCIREPCRRERGRLGLCKLGRGKLGQQDTLGLCRPGQSRLGRGRKQPCIWALRGTGLRLRISHRRCIRKRQPCRRRFGCGHREEQHGKIR
jgi:hypothetical protein